MEIISIFASAIVSGLGGVLISNWYYKKAEKRKTKIMLLQQLIGNRNDLNGERFTEAINSVFIVFHSSKTVIRELKEFHMLAISSQKNEEEMNQKLLDLFKAMCKDLNIEIEPLNDNFFLKPFNVRK